MRRPLWLAAGMAVGVGGTLWAEQRVRRQVRRLSDAVAPTRLAAGARAAAQGTGARVRNAVEAGRDEKVRRQAELWRDLALEAAGDDVSPGRSGRRR